MPVRGFYINLDRDEARRREVEAELEKLDRPYERFSAVDGRSLPPRPGVDNPSELGCFLSHLGVIRQNLGSPDWLHVVEDDVVVSRYAEGAIGTIIQPQYDQHDIIFTNILFPTESWIVSELCRLFDRQVTTGPAGEVQSLKGLDVVVLHNVDFLLTSSYLVNPRSIERLADMLGRALDGETFTPIDKLIQDLARSGELSAGCTIPFFTLPKIESASTIREETSAWRLSHMIMEAALYVDRDIAQLRRLLEQLESPARSMTRNVIAEAFRRAIGAETDIGRPT